MFLIRCYPLLNPLGFGCVLLGLRWLAPAPAPKTVLVGMLVAIDIAAVG